jgi:antirestriction protein ArdC
MSDLDIYQRVTDKIIQALEAGTPPWVRPWSGMDDPIPTNLLSRQPYRGINHVVLSMEAFAKGYAHNGWLTYRQTQALGGQVKRGEHGVNIVFWQFRELADPQGNEADDEAGVGKPRTVPLVKVYTVFNLDQLSGIVDAQPVPTQTWSPEAAAENVLRHSGAQIRHQGYKAFYSPSQDWIVLPPQSLFPDAGNYYGTALHELTHWTGHASRLGRKLGNRFGSDAYAMEELVAEMGAAFLCAQCRLDGHLQHASYISSWLDVLQRDKRAVFVAAAQAQKAADYLIQKLNPTEAEEMPMAA